MTERQKYILIFLISGILLTIGLKGMVGKKPVPYVLSGPAVQPGEQDEFQEQEGLALQGENQEGEAVVAPSPIMVHVEGQVQAPGVYELAPDSRVTDAIEAAGGFTPEAERSGVNLAKRVVDEEQIYVPKKGEILPGSQKQSGGATNGSSSKLVNINKATKEELTTLPGVGPALAERIIAYRRDHGNFQSIEEIMQVSGIGEKKFEALKDYIITN